ncbi:hypothetical protein ON010_g18441 [Phytophthora cinnamomi]|nr:hypothetical protein ON010_g18441 [Phytophthora cinnamomi]
MTSELERTRGVPCDHDSTCKMQSSRDSYLKRLVDARKTKANDTRHANLTGLQVLPDSATFLRQVPKPNGESANSLKKYTESFRRKNAANYAFVVRKVIEALEHQLQAAEIERHQALLRTFHSAGIRAPASVPLAATTAGSPPQFLLDHGLVRPPQCWSPRTTSPWKL